METADDEGSTIHTDIGQLGAAMYEIVTGERCSFDLLRDVPQDQSATWPKRFHLPCLNGVWLGWVIELCWTEGGFQSAWELVYLLEMKLLRVDDEVDRVSGPWRGLTRCLRECISHSVSIVVTLGVVGIAVWISNWRELYSVVGIM